MRPHRRQPTRLPRPWDSPGKNTGVGCHFLLQRMKVKSESEVAQSCPTLSNPMDYSLPGSSIHGIFQARVLKWDVIAFSVPSDKWCPKEGCISFQHLFCFKSWRKERASLLQESKKKNQSLMIQVLVQMGKYWESRKEWVFWEGINLYNREHLSKWEEKIFSNLTF